MKSRNNIATTLASVPLLVVGINLAFESFCQGNLLRSTAVIDHSQPRNLSKTTTTTLCSAEGNNIVPTVLECPPFDATTFALSAKFDVNHCMEQQQEKQRRRQQEQKIQFPAFYHDNFKHEYFLGGYTRLQVVDLNTDYSEEEEEASSSCKTALKFTFHVTDGYITEAFIDFFRFKREGINANAPLAVKYDLETGDCACTTRDCDDHVAEFTCDVTGSTKGIVDTITVTVLACDLLGGKIPCCGGGNREDTFYYQSNFVAYSEFDMHRRFMSGEGTGPYDLTPFRRRCDAGPTMAPSSAPSDARHNYITTARTRNRVSNKANLNLQNTHNADIVVPSGEELADIILPPAEESETGPDKADEKKIVPEKEDKWDDAANKKPGGVFQFAEVAGDRVRDECTLSRRIEVGEVVTGSTINATSADRGVGKCGTAKHPGAPGVWYSLVAPVNETVLRASLCGSSFDTQVSVFRGRGCRDMVCVSGNDDSAECYKASVSTWNSYPSEGDGDDDDLFFIYVNGAKSNNKGDFRLVVTEKESWW